MNNRVYIGLGGNQGKPAEILSQALKKISEIPEIWDLHCSSFYKTTPVGMQDSSDFINAVSVFETSLGWKILYKKLNKIERDLGKIPKAKNEPRLIDIDILFFGELSVQEGTMRIPHSSWQERLFVLVPLLELVSEITVQTKEGSVLFEIPQLLQNFSNKHNETVTKEWV